MLRYEASHSDEEESLQLLARRSVCGSRLPRSATTVAGLFPHGRLRQRRGASRGQSALSLLPVRMCRSMLLGSWRAGPQVTGSSDSTVSRERWCYKASCRRRPEDTEILDRQNPRSSRSGADMGELPYLTLVQKQCLCPWPTAEQFRVRHACL